MGCKWIDEQASDDIDVGFLIERSNSNRGIASYELREHPAHTNQSHEPRLHGWCGSYNDVSTSACGVWKVSGVSHNARLKLVELKGDALLAALDELGYPELMPAGHGGNNRGQGRKAADGKSGSRMNIVIDEESAAVYRAYAERLKGKSDLSLGIRLASVLVEEWLADKAGGLDD